MKDNIGPHAYKQFSDMTPHYQVKFPMATEAYYRTSRNQWTRRVYLLKKFEKEQKELQEEENLYNYTPTWSPPPPLQSDSEEEYQAPIPDTQEWEQWFQGPDDQAEQQNLSLERDINQFVNSTHDEEIGEQSAQLAASLQSNQDMLQQSHRSPWLLNENPVMAHQKYEPTLMPTIPSEDEYKEIVRAAIKKYNADRRRTRKQRKRKRARMQRETEEQQQDQALTVMIKTEKKEEYSNPIFDCGCTAHMWNHRAHFTSYTPYVNSHIKASVADGHKLDILGKGDIGPLKDVLYVPQLKHCLISSSALLDQGYGMYTGSVPKIVKENNPSEVLLKGYYKDRLFQITASEFERQLHLKPVACLVHDISTQPLLHIHQMLGHASAERCAHECRCHRFPGLTNLSNKAFQAIRECAECALAKAHRRSFSGHLDIPEFIGQTWYVDVKGPVAVPSLIYSNHYVFGIIDAKTKFLLQYFMKSKDEVLDYFKLFYDEYIPYVKNLQPTMGAITIYSDMGEFHSQAVIDFCQSKGILHRTTCAYSPQQNGVIERTWRTITEASIAMLITANQSESYWEEARRIAGYIRNRITGGHPSVDGHSPYEKFFGTKPHLRHFKVFGVWAFARIPVKQKDHQPKAQQGIFVGYSDSTMGGYRIYLPQTAEFILSNHVTFGKSPNRTTRVVEEAETEVEGVAARLHLELIQEGERKQRIKEASDQETHTSRELNYKMIPNVPLDTER